MTESRKNIEKVSCNMAENNNVLPGMIRAVIFDMDGVIFDSERIYMEASLEIAEKMHLHKVAEAAPKVIGVTYAKTKETYLTICGQDFPYEAFSAAVSAEFHRVCADGIPVKDGTRELLEFLKVSGIPAVIASSTQTGTVKRELAQAGLLEYFADIVGGDQVSASKPAPDIFLKAVQVLGLDPGECMVIEDSFNGIRAAYAAGTVPVMVPDLLQPDEEIRLMAWKVCPSLREVKSLLADNI